MASMAAFEKELVVATRGLDKKGINSLLAKYARDSLKEVIGKGAGPEYTKYVNGREGAAEETVQAPGPIIYDFSNWTRVITATLEEIRKRSPRRSGRFSASFLVYTQNHVVTDYKAIPSDAEVIIFNFRPYTRKVEAGLLGVPRRRVFDGTKRVMANKFRGAFRFETQFVNVAPGVHPMVPYILKRSQGRSGRNAGDALTYPAIIINSDY